MTEKELLIKAIFEAQAKVTKLFERLKKMYPEIHEEVFRETTVSRSYTHKHWREWNAKDMMERIEDLKKEQEERTE